ncbi:MAG: prephenate dehydratase domain-containing protein [Gemmatimonadales bacterium]
MNRIAFQGVSGAFSEHAAYCLFGKRCEPLPQPTFTAVVEAVQTGAASGGVLPVDNAIVGQIPESLAALMGATAIEITGQVALTICLHLLGLPGATFEGLRRAASHPAALAQCGQFLSAHPKIHAEPWFDTAGAARDVALADDPTFAAIAGAPAAERYGLVILARDVHNRISRPNLTEFIGIRRRT